MILSCQRQKQGDHTKHVELFVSKIPPACLPLFYTLSQFILCIQQWNTFLFVRLSIYEKWRHNNCCYSQCAVVLQNKRKPTPICDSKLVFCNCSRYTDFSTYHRTWIIKDILNIIRYKAPKDFFHRLWRPWVIAKSDVLSRVYSIFLKWHKLC